MAMVLCMTGGAIQDNVTDPIAIRKLMFETLERVNVQETRDKEKELISRIKINPERIYPLEQVCLG